MNKLRKNLLYLLLVLMLTLASCSGADEQAPVEVVVPTLPAETETETETETIAPAAVQEEAEAGYENESGGGAGPNAVGGDDTQGANDSQAGIGFPMVVHLFNEWCGDTVALGSPYCDPWPTIETLEAFCAADGTNVLANMGFSELGIAEGVFVNYCSEEHIDFVREDIRVKLEMFEEASAEN